MPDLLRGTLAMEADSLMVSSNAKKIETVIEEVREQRHRLRIYILRRCFLGGHCKHGMFWPAW